MSKERRERRKREAAMSQWPGKFKRWLAAAEAWVAAGEVGDPPLRPKPPFKLSRTLIIPETKPEWMV